MWINFFVVSSWTLRSGRDGEKEEILEFFNRGSVWGEEKLLRTTKSGPEGEKLEIQARPKTKIAQSLENSDINNETMSTEAAHKHVQRSSKHDRKIHLQEQQYVQLQSGTFWNVLR